MKSVFRIEGSAAHTGALAGGPWNPELQHGGAPAALVAWLAEQVPTAQPMHAVRLTLDLMRPLPIVPLEFKTELLREGRKIQLIGITLHAAGKEVVRASVLKVRAEDMPQLSGVGEAPVDVPLPEMLPTLDNKFVHSSPFISIAELRDAVNGFGKRGPGATWFRFRVPIIEGEENSSFMRAVATADFCNGVSATLGREWTFLNGDLTVNFARMPVGEWILLNAETWVGTGGAGLAAGRLADERGYFGRVSQSLVIERGVSPFP